MSAAARVRGLVAAARRIADPSDPIGQRARRELPGVTGLSPEGVAFALERSLEARPTAVEIELMCSRANPCVRAHVSLGAQVFVAAHRAIAVALAASSEVLVKPSRREPLFTELLRDAGGEFGIVERIEAEAGDAVWLYGSRESIARLEESLPPDVRVHAHGPGIGVAVATEASARVARAIAEDVVLFDQRGCASPRVVIAVGPEEVASHLAQSIACELDGLEGEIPRGATAADELADLTRYRATAAFAGGVLRAGAGVVGIGKGVIVPPPVRSIHVVSCDRPMAVTGVLATLEPLVTVAGVDGDPALVERALPRARVVEIGRMQRVAFDGPVDLRSYSAA